MHWDPEPAKFPPTGGTPGYPHLAVVPCPAPVYPLAIAVTKVVN